MPEAGELWLANIPFTGGFASKIRPVLILWKDSADVIVAAVTSAPSRTKTDVSLSDWAAAGLRVPSTVRLSRLDCLEASLLRRRLGSLSNNDALHVKQVWMAEIRLEF